MRTIVSHLETKKYTRLGQSVSSNLSNIVFYISSILEGLNLAVKQVRITIDPLVFNFNRRCLLVFRTMMDNIQLLHVKPNDVIHGPDSPIGRWHHTKSKLPIGIQQEKTSYRDEGGDSIHRPPTHLGHPHLVRHKAQPREHLIISIFYVIPPRRDTQLIKKGRPKQKKHHTQT